MSRLFLGLIGCLWICPVLFGQAAGPVGPAASPVPSPNQSLSIEDEPGDPPNRAEGLTIDSGVTGPGDSQSDAVGKKETTGSRTSTILGRKRTVSDGAIASSSAPTPWYRTTLGALGLVLGLMGVVFFLLKRWVPSAKLGHGGAVRVVGRTVLGPKQSAVLLHLGHRIVLVGVSPDRVDRVCEIDGAEEVAAILAQSGFALGQSRFSTWLDRETAQFAAESRKDPAFDAVSSHEVGASKSLSGLLHTLRTTKV